APAVVMGAVWAGSVAALVVAHRRRLEAERRARESRLAMLVVAGRLFEAAQGDAFAPPGRIASLAYRTAKALGRSDQDLEDLRMAAWVREVVSAYSGRAVQGATKTDRAFEVVAGLELDLSTSAALPPPETRLGNDAEDVLHAALPLAACVDERWDGHGP